MTAPPVLSSPAASRFPLLNKLSGTSPSHTHTRRAPWLHHYTEKEHPKQAHPNLTSQHTYTHKYTSKHIHKLHAHKHRHTQTRCPSNSFSQPFIWLHARWLECFIFPCVWNWAAVQADTQREREREAQRDRGRERGRGRGRNGEGGRGLLKE